MISCNCFKGNFTYIFVSYTVSGFDVQEESRPCSERCLLRKLHGGVSWESKLFSDLREWEVCCSSSAPSASQWSTQMAQLQQDSQVCWLQIQLHYLYYNKRSTDVSNFMFCSTLFQREISFNEAAVLHYTYAKFSDLTSRRDRCGCKLTKEDIERCFMLDFDRAVSSKNFVILEFFTDYTLFKQPSCYT